MKLHDLHVLMAVVQAGGMGKAAALLNTTQPAISKSIAQLEHAIGVRLLDRGSKGVELTAYGRAMLNRGHAAFDELRQGVKDIEFLADPTSGEARIGTTPPLAGGFISAVIDRLARRSPRIIFQVDEHATFGGVVPEIAARALSERRVDLLIYRKSHDLPNESMSFEKLYESPYIVVTGAKNPWAKRRRIKLAELVGEMWALPPASETFGSFVMNAFRSVGLDYPRASVVALSHELRINLLRTGRYISVLPEFLFRFPTEHSFIRRLPVELPITDEPIGIITLKNRTPSPVVQRFIDCAREVANPLAKKK